MKVKKLVQTLSAAMCVSLLGLATGCNGVQDQIADTTALAAQIVDVWI